MEIYEGMDTDVDRDVFFETLQALIATKREDNCFYFSKERYSKTISEVISAKTKCSTPLDYRRLKRFDVLKVDDEEKLIVPLKPGETNAQYYVINDELFTILSETHTRIGHGGRTRMLKELQVKYKNVTHEVVMLYLNLCKYCRMKNNVLIRDESVKTKWKTLRDGYNKYKKQVKRDISHGKKSHQYIWSSQLSFLDDVNASHATTSSNTSSENKPLQSSREPTPSLESNDSHSFVELQSFNLPEEETPLQSFNLPQEEKSPSSVDIAASTSQAPVETKQPNRKKRPIQGDVDKVLDYLHDKKKIKQDGIDHLFLSYADTFRKLPPRHQIHIKLELAKLFADAELECLEETEEPEETEDVKPSFIEISSPCHPTISSSSVNPSQQQSEQHNLFQEVDQPEYYLPDNC
ncbi:unnamed protein product [Diabrotica balteata]|uniref:MADF domain-containing protein n=1 Tax=Diabrotica balteata TaxID=107213 RepID=A0A9N9T5P6_DIABA|nr:unnamed protein product [Diabrotica balteata]